MFILQLIEVYLFFTEDSSRLSRESSVQLRGAWEVEAEPRRTESRATVLLSSLGSAEVKGHRQTCGVNL